MYYTKSVVKKPLPKSKQTNNNQKYSNNYIWRKILGFYANEHKTISLKKCVLT